MTDHVDRCPDPRDHERVTQLGIAVESNRVIGAAVGIIMVRQLLTYDRALESLRTASARLNRRVIQLATEIVETGAMPSTLTSAGNSRWRASRHGEPRCGGGRRDLDPLEPGPDGTRTSDPLRTQP